MNTNDLKPKTYKLKANPGFTLIELLVVTAITAILATVFVVNFGQLRTTQQVMAAQNETLSKIREVQNYVLTGSQVSGQAPSAYEISLSSSTTSYTVKFVVAGATTTLETVNLPTNMQIRNLFVNGLADNQVNIQIYAPFGKIYVDNVPNQTVLVELNHVTGNIQRTILIEAISGRVGRQ